MSSGLGPPKVSQCDCLAFRRSTCAFRRFLVSFFFFFTTPDAGVPAPEPGFDLSSPLAAGVAFVEAVGVWLREVASGCVHVCTPFSGLVKEGDVDDGYFAFVRQSASLDIPYFGAYPTSAK